MSIFSTILSVVAGLCLALFFKPLLVGLFRAACLWLNPRLTPEERAARRNMRDARMLHRMIKETNSPGLAAELRAIGARS